MKTVTPGRIAAALALAAWPLGADAWAVTACFSAAVAWDVLGRWITMQQVDIDERVTKACDSIEALKAQLAKDVQADLLLLSDRVNALALREIGR